jgi:hypothetical protein
MMRSRAFRLRSKTAPVAQHALAVYTVLDAVNATTTAAIFNNVIFTKASQVNEISNN